MKNIAVIPNATKDIDLRVTRKLAAMLAGRARLYMDKAYAESGIDASFGTASIYDHVDMAIVLGGDGTILNVAAPCARRGIPIMGVNLGTIGFMAEIEVSELDTACGRLLSGDYQTEKRMMVKISVKKSDGTISDYHALNDVVISKQTAKMISISLYSDHEKINAFVADGLIISTPTGSTGYSLSAGGPVADPTMELFIASPICAHMLNARPALMPADKSILLRLADGSADALVTVDGEIKEHITSLHEVIISRSNYFCELIKMGKQSFYNTLIHKLS